MLGSLELTLVVVVKFLVIIHKRILALCLVTSKKNISAVRITTLLKRYTL